MPPTASEGDRSRALATDPGYSELSRQATLLAAADSRTKQATLGKIAILPAIMLACYLGLVAYFRSIGGYRIASIK